MSFFQQHQPESAKEYAVKSYALVANSNTSFDFGLADLIIVKWPEIRESGPGLVQSNPLPKSQEVQLKP